MYQCLLPPTCNDPPVSLPRWPLQVGRSLCDAYHRHSPFLRHYLLGEPAPDFRPLNAAYPDVPIEIVDRPRSFALPGAPALPLRRDAQHLASRQYVPPLDFVACLPKTTYCSTHHVLLDEQRQIVRESCNAGKLEYFRLRDFYDAPARRISGPVTPWKLRFFNYYHLLIEALPRLLALERTTLLSSPGDVQLLCPGGLSATDRFFLAKLGLDRLPILEVEAGPLYTTEALVLSSLKTQLQSGFLPPWYAQTMQERLLPARPSKRAKRLFISRERAWRRGIANNAAVTAALRDYGFEPVVMEELTPQQQIEIVYDAEAVVAPHGAGLTNILFGRHLRVLELFPGTEIAPHYVFLAASLGHHYEYLLGTEQTLNPSAFTVDVEALREAVERLLTAPTTAPIRLTLPTRASPVGG